MIKLKELLDVVETHQNKPKEIIKEAKYSDLPTSPTDHWVIDRSFNEITAELGNGANLGYSESWDVYGWNDQGNYKKAVGELNKYVTGIAAPYFKARDKFLKDAGKAYKEKDKIFNKWRKNDGSEQGD
tara:strand:- start:320 stop:703 length:384 start_codon:yes stop_codon:yes gene_type:complete